MFKSFSAVFFLAAKAVIAALLAATVAASSPAGKGAAPPPPIKPGLPAEYELTMKGDYWFWKSKDSASSPTFSLVRIPQLRHAEALSLLEDRFLQLETAKRVEVKGKAALLIQWRAYDLSRKSWKWKVSVWFELSGETYSFESSPYDEAQSASVMRVFDAALKDADATN